MATVSNTPRPGYVWDATDNVWYPIGVGGHGHSDYITQATAISPTTVDAKGDLLVGSAADTIARLAVGNSGEQLVADSSTSTGLRYQATQTAGKNAVINGDFLINQRAFTSNTTSTAYNFDRWLQQNSGGTFTVTPQTFTPGAAPIATYEGRKYLQGITASQSAAGHYAIITQRIEDVTRYAGTTVTISFFAKADTGTPKIGVELWQDYGTGGSPSAAGTVAQSSVTLSTSWARYSVTVAVPSLTGKTLGTTANTSYLELNLWTSAGSTHNTRASSIGIQNFTASIWGVQLEYGSVATYFTTATGTLQGELAACYRYFQKFGGTQVNESFPYTGFSYSTTQGEGPLTHKGTMRTTPSLAFSTLKISDVATYNLAVTNLTLTTSGSGPDASYLVFTVASGTSSGKINYMRTDASTAGYIYLSAEL